MNKESYSDFIFKEKIKENYEHSEIINYGDSSIKKEVYFYDELENKVVKGFPFASDFVNKEGASIDYEAYSKLNQNKKKDYRLRFHYLPYMHELYIGTTGSGKTTTCIEPQLRAISSQKNKPNIFITDPKGEIFSHNAKHLKEKGYKIQVINFKNVEFSNKWNPLEEIYEKQMEILCVGKTCVKVSGDQIGDYVESYSDKISKDGYYYLYNNIAFSSEEEFKSYCDTQKFQIHSKVSSMVNQLTRQMFPDNMRTRDRTWSEGSKEFISGIILALLDDAINPNKNFTKEMFNIKTINDVFSLVAKNKNEPYGKLKEFLEGKSKEAVDKMSIVTNTAEKTKRSYLSVCQALLSNWMRGHIFSITSETDIRLDDSEKPLALFIVTRDYDKSDNIIAGLFINWVYNKFLVKAEETGRINGIAASRPLHFLLDEFANIPPIPDFETKIATSRSRNIWFHIFLQSYDQLDCVYKKEIAKIIIDNCNQQTFLGSQSVKTKEKFSKECGKKTIKKLNSLITGKDEGVNSVNVLTTSTLNTIKPGCLYIKRIKMDLIKSTFVRSYECANEGVFKDFENAKFEDYLPFNLSNPNSDKFLYKEVIPDEFLKDFYDGEFLALDIDKTNGNIDVDLDNIYKEDL